MKQIEAIIKPFKLEEVKEALIKIGVGGMTVSEVRGVGKEKGHSQLYRGVEYSSDFLPKVKIQILTNSENAAQIVETIIRASRTGKIGDGKILVTDIDELVRIRTGEKGAEAL